MIIQFAHEILKSTNGFRVDFTRNPDKEDIISIDVYDVHPNSVQELMNKINGIIEKYEDILYQNEGLIFIPHIITKSVSNKDTNDSKFKISVEWINEHGGGYCVYLYNENTDKYEWWLPKTWLDQKGEKMMHLYKTQEEAIENAKKEKSKQIKLRMEI